MIKIEKEHIILRKKILKKNEQIMELTKKKNEKEAEDYFNDCSTKEWPELEL